MMAYKTDKGVLRKPMRAQVRKRKVIKQSPRVAKLRALL